MPYFQKKPVVIVAEQFDSERTPWPKGVVAWNPKYAQRMHPETLSEWEARLGAYPVPRDMSWGFIPTLEGAHHVIHGDWIVTGTAGEIYPVKDKIFRQIYNPYNPDSNMIQSWELYESRQRV